MFSKHSIGNAALLPDVHIDIEMVLSNFVAFCRWLNSIGTSEHPNVGFSFVRCILCGVAVLALFVLPYLLARALCGVRCVLCAVAVLALFVLPSILA